jgi:S1-C subfamily serine protease
MSRLCPVWMAVLVLLTVGLVAQAQPGGAPEAPRGYLGILVGPAEEGGTGVMVREVTAGSPAAKAGLKSGDRVVKLGDEDVTDVERFLRAVAAKKPGDKLTLGVLRDGKEQKLTVTLGERAGREGPAFPELPGLRRPAFLGVQTQALTAELKERLNANTDAGAVITEVVPNSPADRAGLKRDDVITAVDDRPVKTPADLRDAVQKAGPGKEVTLQVVRGKEKRAVKATLREGAFGFFLTPGEDQFPTVDVESMFDQGRRIRELERRVEELEKRLRALEKK